MIFYVLLFTFILSVQASTLIKPPRTALIVAFENVYDLSLLANTLSDQGIDVVLFIPATNADEVHENLIDVEVIKVNFTIDENAKREEKALKACEAFLSSKQIMTRVQQDFHTFTIFPAVRHDACLFTWARRIESIPIVWAQGYEDEHYVIHNSKMAIPIHTSGIVDRFWANLNAKGVIGSLERNYIAPAIELTQKYFNDGSRDQLHESYTNLQLFLWGSDRILRWDFAPLTDRIIETSCHHCRGIRPLPEALQKQLIEFRLGTIAVTLDSDHYELINMIAERLPQGRQGQAVAWKNKKLKSISKKSENLFIYPDVDRQDLIGYSRVRVVLMRCSDTELLEAAFHGTSVLCIPRTSQETKNTLRAVDFGLTIPLNGDYSINNILKAIDEIHQNKNYRDSARKVSLTLRDRIIPSSDTIAFWLTLTAKNKETDGAINYWQVGKEITVKTFDEDVKFFYGLLIGIVFGVFFTITTVLTWYWQGKDRNNKLPMTKVKGKKYTR